MMKDQIGIACVGEWHVHGKDFADKLMKYPHCKMIAVCSDNPESGRIWAEQKACLFEPDYGRLLKNPEIDAVMITSATADHRHLIVAAANAGKHVFVEKALAVTNEEAYAIREAVEKNGIHFTMSDPVMKAPQMFVKELIREGVLGKITNARIRVTHPLGILGQHKPQFYNKAESGGGTMIDMGCKAAHTLYQLFGKPVSACGMFHSYTDIGNKNQIDENAVVLYRFPQGILAVAENGWVSPKYQYALEVYGTNGCAVIYDTTVQYRLNDGEWRTVPESSLPEPMIYPLDDWIESIECDRPNDNYGIEEAVHITEMITAAYRSEGMETAI